MNGTQQDAGMNGIIMEIVRDMNVSRLIKGHVDRVVVDVCGRPVRKNVVGELGPIARTTIVPDEEVSVSIDVPKYDGLIEGSDDLARRLRLREGRALDEPIVIRLVPKKDRAGSRRLWSRDDDPRGVLGILLLRGETERVRRGR